MKYLLIILVLGLLVSVIYLTWENRDSNTLILKVLSFFTVGLLSIILTVLLQDKKEDIYYKTTTALFVDEKNYPIVVTDHIEKKDFLVLDLVTSLENKDLYNSMNYKEYNFNFISRVFINLMENIFYKSWYIEHNYNKLTNSTSWGPKGNEESDFVKIENINIFTNQDFKVNIEGINDNGFNIPKNTKILYEFDSHSKKMIFENKYFTYTIEISFNQFWRGFGKFSNIFQNYEGSTYYYDIKTHCTFSELYPNNPMVKKYEEWVNNTNDLIDFHFNSLKSFNDYEQNRERRRLVAGGYKNVNDILGIKDPVN